MSVPKSQRMSYSGIAGWSLLCGVVTDVLAMVIAILLRSLDKYAFNSVSPERLALLFGGVFVLGAATTMIWLLSTKWMEEEGPAEIADEIERKWKR